MVIIYIVSTAVLGHTDRVEAGMHWHLCTFQPPLKGKAMTETEGEVDWSGNPLVTEWQPQSPRVKLKFDFIFTWSYFSVISKMVLFKLPFTVASQIFWIAVIADIQNHQEELYEFLCNVFWTSHLFPFFMFSNKITKNSQHCIKKEQTEKQKFVWKVLRLTSSCSFCDIANVWEYKSLLVWTKNMCCTHVPLWVLSRNLYCF